MWRYKIAAVFSAVIALLFLGGSGIAMWNLYTGYTAQNVDAVVMSFIVFVLLISAAISAAIVSFGLFVARDVKVRNNILSKEYTA